MSTLIQLIEQISVSNSSKMSTLIQLIEQEHTRVSSIVVVVVVVVIVIILSNTRCNRKLHTVLPR